MKKYIGYLLGALTIITLWSDSLRSSSSSPSSIPATTAVGSHPLPVTAASIQASSIQTVLQQHPYTMYTVEDLIDRLVASDPESEREWRPRFYKKAFTQIETEAAAAQNPVSGMPDYNHPLTEMLDTIKQKVQSMHHKGDIMSQSEADFLELFRDPKRWTPLGSNDLTVLWGAEFLAKQLTKHSMTNWHVPRYIIVVPDSHYVNVGIQFDNCAPVLKTVEGTIYVENIENGTDAKADYPAEKGWQVGFEFIPDKLLKNKTGLYMYHMIPGRLNIPRANNLFCDFLRKGFFLLHNFPLDTTPALVGRPNLEVSIPLVSSH